MKTKLALLALGGLGLVSFPAFAAVMLNGAGATFPYPIYSKWISDYQKTHPDVQINYQSIGSGGGIRQFQEKTVDFGATDAPMTDEQLRKSPEPVVHVPTVLGAVVVTYNLPELGATRLNLDGETIANLFLGRITQWNDPRIAALNPGVTLPSEPVLVVHRSDGSGTSAVFTDYLSKVSADWKSRVGTSTSVSWPTGLGGKGNEGVSGLVRQTPGSVGYVELIYAASNSIPYAKLKNKSGAFVDASPKSVTSAADASAKLIPRDFRVSITDAAGAGSYPISSFTYLLVGETLTGEKGKSLLGFLNWALTDGQLSAESMQYAPLPKALTKKVLARIQAIQVK